ncbi:uncharacterized protein LOC129586087 [Paramacrobiotus metropolitanus]|uniref:uncharacterized protein LOC129586087 n=1 Tax=Paramacrobiotus metropolitanus TaxID=2943436 RepID=UPI002446263A|nr:uncharacterized protein LOC129586087 [Paramacrobiotus metropolitanus]
MELENGTRFSTNGSPLMLITYMLPVPDVFFEKNFPRSLPQYKWLFAPNELGQNGPSSMNEFIQRLQIMGLTAYDGPALYKSGGILDDIYLRANSTYGFFDTDQLKADVLGIVKQKRIRQNCSDTSVDDVEVHFGQLEPGIVTSRANGKYSDVNAMSIPVVIKLILQQKVLLSDSAAIRTNFVDWFPLPNHADRYYLYSLTAQRRNINTTGLHLVDHQPLNPAHSFRMHLDRPLNVQWMPLLEAQMTSQLNNNTTDRYNLAEVRIWNFDPDGWVVNFFVILQDEHRTLAEFVLDGRMQYAASIYRKLDGLELRVPSASKAYRLMTHGVDEDQKNTIKATILRACEGRGTWIFFPTEEQECPLKKNFTLYIEWQSERLHSRDLVNGSVTELPNSDKILEAVQQAFAAANPVTMDNITLALTMTKCNDSVPTPTGFEAAKISFAVSYPKMRSGLYWNVWRYASFDELKAALQSTANVILVRARNLAGPASDY